MTSERRGPTLTDQKGMGGIIAQDGFDYQVWDALIRLPDWIRNPAFEGVVVEALEDLEARFFAPHSARGHLLDRFQAKSGTLTPTELVRVITSFATFEAAYPRAARVQTLVTPGLPAALTWIARDPKRVQRARPFYAPFADIRDASEDKLREDLVEQFGRDVGDFFADSIEVSVRILPDRASAEAAFAASLQGAFPDLDVNVRRMQAAFEALNGLFAQSRGAMLSRDVLMRVFGEALGTELVRDRRLRLHIRSDRNGEVSDALEIDASAFSGGPGGFPEPERWRTELLAPLETTARWAGKHHIQRIALSGSYRLSTAFALGWAFRSATGFEIDIPTRSEPWATDEHPTNATVPPWTTRQPQALIGDRLVIGIGVLRDPAPDVRQDLALADDTNMLLATLSHALRSGSEAQASAQILKAAVTEAVARLRPVGIDIFYVGPAAFAVTLGHRWNALPPTRLYEFQTDRGYRQTILIG